MFSTSIRGASFSRAGSRPSRARRRRIIATSTGGTKMMFPNAALYLGSKGGSEQFARSLSRELGPRSVTVNVLSPGFTDTDMLPEQYREYGASLSPFNRVGTAKEVADVAAFLASDAARSVTGRCTSRRRRSLKSRAHVAAKRSRVKKGRFSMKSQLCRCLLRDKAFS